MKTKKRIVWLVVGCLTVAALVLASCAPAVVEEEEEEKKPVVEEKKPVVEEKKPVVEEEEEEAEMVTLTLTKMDGTKVTKTVEKPKYGGTIVFSNSHGSQNWEPGGMGTYMDFICQYQVYQPFTMVDWWRGKAGTGEIDLVEPYFTDDYFIPLLAESWEIVSPTEIVFNLRQGVHYHDKPPANGREMVAEDAVFSLIREGTFSGGAQFIPRMGDKIHARDKYTVVIELHLPLFQPIKLLSWQHWVFPPEIVAGDEPECDERVRWQDTCATGPYILTDFVSGSSATAKRNPNYWQYDPLFPENRLPYADEIKELYIVDLATRMAALRTGKIDRLWDVTVDESDSLVKTNPELLRHGAGSTGDILFLRVDLEPFTDLRVRRALAMGIDRQTILRDYFKGKADLVNYPTEPNRLGTYTPFEELPEEVKELYVYNPEKAKQLLAEAGYPDGFKTTILVGPYPTQKDMALIVKDNWEDIGVTAELSTPTAAVFYGITKARKYETVFYATSGRPDSVLKSTWSPRHTFNHWWGVDEEGMPNWHDAEIVERQAEVLNCTDPKEQVKLLKELNLFLTNKVFSIEMPGPYTYYMWQPWLKGYHGESALSQTMSMDGMYWLTWVDQDLKEAMTGKR